MKFGILGPIEIHDSGGNALPLQGIKPRVTLAVLLLNANEPVSADRLALALWGRDTPSARKAVQVYISRLRKTLDNPQIIATTPAGYRLRLLPEELDATVFEHLVEKAEHALDAGGPERAGNLLRDALALWRGPALAELGYEDWAQAEIRRLEELRFAALEARVDADLRAGKHAALIGELELLVASHPTRERLAAQLMIALYRCDRQADALNVYQRTRTTLNTELGLEPGNALKALHVQILTQAPSLDPAPTPTVNRGIGGAVPLPAVLRSLRTTPYVGRISERALIRQLMDGARAGSRGIVFIGGEPGMGKTRLAALTALEAQTAGFSVSWGASAEDLDAPYATWIGALSHLVDHAPKELLTAHVRRHGGAVSRLVPALAVRVACAPLAQESDPEIERYLLFAAIAGLVEELCASGPLALVLDDFQWADKQSLALLHHVAGTSAHLPLLILVTYRDSDLDSSHPLSSLLADLHRLEGIQRISLGGLRIDEVAGLMAGDAGQDNDAGALQLATQITDETAGNPFFVGRSSATCGSPMRCARMTAVAGGSAERSLMSACRRASARWSPGVFSVWASERRRS